MFLLHYLGESVVAPNPIAKVSPHVHKEKGKGRNIQVLLPRLVVVRRGGGGGGAEAQFVQVQKNRSSKSYLEKRGNNKDCYVKNNRETEGGKSFQK